MQKQQRHISTSCSPDKGTKAVKANEGQKIVEAGAIDLEVVIGANQLRCAARR
jgi:hypothetical protein